MSRVAARDLSLQCRCGAVRAVAQGVTPDVGNHCVCFCNDCQAFAKFLGRASDVLDAHGGTDIFQLSQARVRFTHGVDRVACVRLSPKGLARWYASCCNTPIGNTLATPAVPFVGVIRAFVSEPASDALGPIRSRAYRPSATGDKATIPRDIQPQWRMLLRMMGLFLRWRLRGDHKHSPFFDPSGAPLKKPRTLTGTERAALR